MKVTHAQEVRAELFVFLFLTLHYSVDVILLLWGKLLCTPPPPALSFSALLVQDLVP